MNEPKTFTKKYIASSDELFIDQIYSGSLKQACKHYMNSISYVKFIHTGC
jgi:hypothetical protein